MRAMVTQLADFKEKVRADLILFEKRNICFRCGFDDSKEKLI